MRHNITLRNFLRVCAERNMFLTNMGETLALFQSRNSMIQFVVEYMSNDDTIVRIIRPNEYHTINAFTKGDIELKSLLKPMYTLDPVSVDMNDAITIALEAVRDDMVATYKNDLNFILF